MPLPPIVDAPTLTTEPAELVSMPTPRLSMMLDSSIVKNTWLANAITPVFPFSPTTLSRIVPATTPEPLNTTPLLVFPTDSTRFNVTDAIWLAGAKRKFHRRC